MSSLPAGYTLAATLSPASPSPRDAVVDAFYRCVLGFDAPDAALFESALTADATFEMNGQLMVGLPAIRAECWEPVSKLDTTHFVTNVRVTFPLSSADGAGGAAAPTVAHATASALSQHYPAGKGCEPGAPKFMTGSLYMAELVPDPEGSGSGGERLWKIRAFRMKSTWFDGDQSVMTSESQ